jgi:calcium-dependent protein kinase
LRVQWEKKLIQKLKQIIEGSEVGSVEKLFKLLDVDESGSVTLEELRVGLEAYNIFINQSDLSNLFSLLDADKSGTINLEEFQTLLGKEQSNKKVPELDPDSFNK